MYNKIMKNNPDNTAIKNEYIHVEGHDTLDPATSSVL
jgi:hypothetical protein